METGYRVFTNWIVFTGAPYAGKTTVINELKKRGYRVVLETARVHLESEINKGKFPIEIRRDEPIFQYNILKKKLIIEKSLPTKEIIFLDRAIPDSLPYLEIAGAKTKNLIEFCKIFRYRLVFIFDRFNYKKDNIRIEEEWRAQQLNKSLENIYTLLDYDVIRVPIMTVDERINFILEIIQNTKNKWI